MTDIAAQNLQLLGQRWPALATSIIDAPPPADVAWADQGSQPALVINGLRLWSAYDPDSEADLQAANVPDRSLEATVYGVGGGDLIRVLLRREQIKKLRVVVLNKGLLHLLLHVLDHRDWLSDPRTELLDGARQAKVEGAFAAIPPCLALADSTCADLRDRVTDHLLRPFERQRHAQREPLRRRQIEQNLGLIRDDGDVRELFDSQPGCTAYVAIAGPTLSKTAPWLRDQRAGGVLVAVDGALGPLLELGLVPDVVVSVDENRDTILRYFQRDLSACAKSVLVYAPLVHNDVLRLWPGPRLTTYTFESVYAEARKQYPKGELYVAGSVSHPAVDLACKTGAHRVLLFGADFGFPGGQIHANRDAPIEFYANAASAGATTINGHGEPIATLRSFNGYRLGLEDYIAHFRGVEFVNMSRNGARIAGTVYPDTK